MDPTDEPSSQAARPIVIELGREKVRRAKAPEPKTGRGRPRLRPAAGAPEREGGPLVLEYEKPQERQAGPAATDSAKFSPELRQLQVAGTDIVRATHKAVLALAKGIETYEQARLRSMQAKKDGALEDFVTNASKAVSAWMKEASNIPLDLSEALRRGDEQRRARRRRASRALRQWRD